MDRIAEIVARMRGNSADIRFVDAVRVCDHYFGQPRQSGSSHIVYRMPWPGDPRVNIQRSANVRQILRAIDRLEAEHAN